MMTDHERAQGHLALMMLAYISARVSDGWGAGLFVFAACVFGFLALVWYAVCLIEIWEDRR